MSNQEPSEHKDCVRGSGTYKLYQDGYNKGREEALAETRKRTEITVSDSQVSMLYARLRDHAKQNQGGCSKVDSECFASIYAQWVAKQAESEAAS